MELPNIGTGVDYLSKSSADGETTTQEGVVIGFDPMPEGSVAELPPAHLAYLHPDRLSVLGGADWRTAFDRVASVPHFSAAHGKRHCYKVRGSEVAPVAEVEKEEEKKPEGSEPADAFEMQKAKDGKAYVGHDGKNYRVSKGGLIEVEPKGK